MERSRGRAKRKWGTHLPDSFLIMFRNESTTPYTSFDSSSNESADVGAGGCGAMGL